MRPADEGKAYAYPSGQLRRRLGGKPDRSKNNCKRGELETQRAHLIDPSPENTGNGN